MKKKKETAWKDRSNEIKRDMKLVKLRRGSCPDLNDFDKLKDKLPRHQGDFLFQGVKPGKPVKLS